MNLKRAGEVVHAQHRVPVAAERRHMKGAGDIDEQSLRTSISAAFGSIWHGVTSHPGLRALPTWTVYPPNTVIKRESKRFLAIGGLHKTGYK